MRASAGMREHRTDREGDVAEAGDAGSWGVATTRHADAESDRTLPAVGSQALGVPLSVRGRCRYPVTPCRGASDTGGADLTPARGDGRGGAASVPGARRRALRRPRAPPRRRAL